MKRLKKIADSYYPNNDNSISKEKLQQCAEECCNRLGVDISSIQVDDSLKAYVILGDDSFTLSIDFYNEADGPEINRIIVSAPKGFPGTIKYVETREQQDLENFLYEPSYFINWVDEALEKIEASEIQK